jgi:hypothetical protein
MSEATTNDVGWAAAAIGGILAGFLGAVVGVLLASLYGEGGFVASVFLGILCGGAPAFLTAAAMAFHGAAIGRANDLATASRWGVLTGAVAGLSVAPLLGIVVGWGLGAPGLGGLTGVLFGAVAGVLGWQAGYWLAHMSGR